MCIRHEDPAGLLSVSNCPQSTWWVGSVGDRPKHEVNYGQALNHESAIANMKDLEVRIGQDGSTQVYRRHKPAEGVLPRSWWDKTTYAACEYGSATLTNLFGEVDAFSFAKSPFAVQDCLWVAGLDDDTDNLVLDFFAGSGTTAHAVMNLNATKGREAHETRRMRDAEDA